MYEFIKTLNGKRNLTPVPCLPCFVPETSPSLRPLRLASQQKNPPTTTVTAEGGSAGNGDGIVIQLTS